jgi:hypothetical protein
VDLLQALSVPPAVACPYFDFTLFHSAPMR